MTAAPFMVAVEIPADVIESCIESAIREHTHWLRTVTLVELGTPAPSDGDSGAATWSMIEHVMRGGKLRILPHDATPTPGLIDRAAIESGLAVLSATLPHHLADLIHDNADAATGDYLLQCAAFGEVAYE